MEKRPKIPNKLTNVRNILIETMETLLAGEMEVDRAQAIADVGKVLVESAKVEVAMLKLTGGTVSEFILPNEEPTTSQKYLNPENTSTSTASNE